MSFNEVQVTFFIEHEGLTLNQGHDLLKNIIGGQIDFIYKYPVTIFDSFDEISFKKAED